MNKLNHFTRRKVFITLLLTIVMVLAYLAGTISVEAGWFTQEETRATTNQKAAVSAVISLLLLNGEVDQESVPLHIYLPLIVR